jgi:hypothetical protein
MSYSALKNQFLTASAEPIRIPPDVEVLYPKPFHNGGSIPPVFTPPQANGALKNHKNAVYITKVHGSNSRPDSKDINGLCTHYRPFFYELSSKELKLISIKRNLDEGAPE